jgi:hypothetical protein
MALQPVKTNSFGGVPIWVRVIETATGGFKLVITGLNSGDVLPAGTPIKIDESARTATVSKTAIVYEATSGTSIKVKKGHQFQATNNAAKTLGDAAYAVSAIDASNAAYDVFTVGTSLGALSVGDVLFQSSAAGATAAAYSVVPNALMLQPVPVVTDEPVAAVIHGTVYQRRIPGITSDMITALKNIIFNQSV